MMPFFDFFLGFFYPRRCLSCGRFGKYICDACVSKIYFIETTICPVCEKPAIDGKTHPGCQRRYSLDGLTSVFLYQGVIREAIKKIKYKPFAFDIGKALISLALERVDQKSLFFRIIKKKATLVPIPLHPSRERLRGFNQAEVLGKMIAEEWGLLFIPGLLTRSKDTRPQVKLKGRERRENVKGAFKVNPKFQNLNSKILLFDDVWTTGATMRTCGHVLKRAGVKFVWGLTLAR